MTVKKKNLIFYALAFIVPIIIALIFFQKLGLYPFSKDGERKSLLMYDYWMQYFPFYVENHNNVTSFGSSDWSWNSFLGFNVFAQDAYYTHSFFSIFMYAVGRSAIQAVLHYIAILRFGVASFTFCFFLRYKYNKLNLATVSFGLLYAFCGYMLAFITQPMWLDMVIILPLVILGLERLIIKGRPVGYCLALFWAIWINYYIAVSLCIFLVLYFIWYVISHSDILKSYKVKRAVKLFAVCSLLGGALAAFELIPVLKALSETSFESNQFPEKSEYINRFTEIFAKLLPASKFTIVWQVPNIFSGIITLLLVPIFFFNDKFSLRKKITSIAFILILIASFNNNILLRVWHAMNYPNQLNGRWTFMFSFFLIMLAYEAFVNFKFVKIKGLLGGLAISLLIVIAAKGNLNTNDEYIVTEKIVKWTIIALCVYTFIFILLKKIRIQRLKNVLIAAVGIVVILEAGINATASFTRKNPNVPDENLVYNFPEFDIFSDKDEEMEQFKYLYGAKENDFYRSEINSSGLNLNDGQVYDYNGIAYYASSLPSDGYNFFKNMGYSVYATDRSIIYNPSFAVLNSMLNLKYIADLSNNLNVAGMEQVYEGGTFRVLENKYYLPVAFKVSEDLLNWYPDKNKDSIQNQNDFVNAAMGEDLNIYTPILENRLLLSNVDFPIDGGDGKQYYLRKDSSQKVTIEYEFSIEKSGDYIIRHGIKVGMVGIIVNGYNTITREVNDENQVMEIGHFNEGDKVIIHFERDGTDYGLFSLETYLLDESKLAKMHEMFSEHSAKIRYADDTKLEMTLNVDEGGLIYTSVPDNEGWKVKVNGRKVTATDVGGYLLAFRVPAGNNEIELEYHLPGRFAGLTISIFAFLLLVVCMLNAKYKFGEKYNISILKFDDEEPETVDVEMTDYVDTSLRELSFDSNIEIDFSEFEEVAESGKLTEDADVKSVDGENDESENISDGDKKSDVSNKSDTDDSEKQDGNKK
jgi:uncharacterized membrane protein YfhO